MQPDEKMVIQLQSLSNCSLRVGAEAQGAMCGFFSRGDLGTFKKKSAMEEMVWVRKSIPNPRI